MLFSIRFLIFLAALLLLFLRFSLLSFLLPPFLFFHPRLPHLFRLPLPLFHPLPPCHLSPDDEDLSPEEESSEVSVEEEESVGEVGESVGDVEGEGVVGD